jgi:apolipoprotein N-acyltransferase
MKREWSTRLVFVFLGVVGLLWVAPVSAFGYIDPGSASMFFQILIGSLLGAVVAVRMYWQRLKVFFRRGNAQKPKQP